MSNEVTALTNVRLCRSGTLTSNEPLIFSPSTGLILPPSTDLSTSRTLDLQGAIVAPGFLELQTNGLRGFHFTHFSDAATYAEKLDEVARYLPQTGVTGFYVTVPTVHADEFKKILPSLHPRSIAGGASLLGAHAEGPYLHPSKKGAHNSFLFHPASHPAEDIYGETAASNAVLKLVTLAPELQDSQQLISTLTSRKIRVSLGHSTATYTQGLAALHAGATCLTHTLNAMPALHHRDPGLAGLVTAPEMPYFSIIPDGNHLHPSIATLLFRANPAKCILITDSIELAGLPDGTYPGHAQIPHAQTKLGTRVTIEGTETLIGGCASLMQCIKNLNEWSGCGVAAALRCVTENVADFMGEGSRGVLEAGRRADFVVLGDEGGGELGVRETWVGGRKVWER